MDFKAFIFDMDGVIFDSERAVIDCWKVIAPQYGITDIETHCIAATGLNEQATRRIFKEQYGEDMPYDEMRAKRKALFIERFDQGLVAVKQGTEDLLSFLKTNSYKVALASSTSEGTVRRELAAAGLIEYFDVIIGGDKVTHSKPDPEIFLMAMEQLGVRPEEAAVIEDSYNGVRAANASGAYTIMVPDLLPPTDEMREKADIIRDSLSDVLEWIKENE
ncbi:MAG: HAD family phosphatase [Saccharofermentans sp.]|nr:HAD family phosphatase [Saccharofermentans sp.]